MSDIRVEILPTNDARVSVEVCADAQVWGVTVATRQEAHAVAWASVRGIVRTRRLRACVEKLSGPNMLGKGRCA